MMRKREKEWDAMKALRSRPSSMYQEISLSVMRDISTKPNERLSFTYTLTLSFEGVGCLSIQDTGL